MIWLEWVAKVLVCLSIVKLTARAIRETRVPEAPVINWIGDTVGVALTVGVAWLAMFAGWRG